MSNENQDKGASASNGVLAGGVGMIARERQRQIEQEGWTPEHDDEHDLGELSIAAACYAVAGTDAHVTHPDAEEEGGDYFPWAAEYDKRDRHDRIRQLTVAGALIAAEIDRLQRKREAR